MKENKKQEDYFIDKKNKLEWGVFFLSITFIFCVLGYLIYETATYEASSPDLVIEYRSDPTPHAPYRYHVSILNLGRETAEEVQIELVLVKDGKEIEKATMEIPFSPHNSKREGWVNFSKNPKKADTVYGRVVSYKKS